MDYKSSGVDIDAGNETVRRIRGLARSTFTSGVLSDIGSFGGLFQLESGRYKHPVLVSSADGVGTKLKVAFLADRHDTVGVDLVNHCVNDILVQGARPLFFLDYFATGGLEPNVVVSVVEGVARGCRENGCALIGGETAEMPGFYAAGEYDIAGFIVGVVDRQHVITGASIEVGDVAIGLPSVRPPRRDLRELTRRTPRSGVSSAACSSARSSASQRSSSPGLGSACRSSSSELPWRRRPVPTR